LSAGNILLKYTRPRRKCRPTRRHVTLHLKVKVNVDLY